MVGQSYLWHGGGLVSLRAGPDRRITVRPHLAPSLFTIDRSFPSEGLIAPGPGLCEAMMPFPLRGPA